MSIPKFKEVQTTRSKAWKKKNTNAGYNYHWTSNLFWINFVLHTNYLL